MEGTAYAKTELQIVMGSSIGSRSTKVENRGWGDRGNVHRELMSGD